jgi:hypothetical protein
MRSRRTAIPTAQRAKVVFGPDQAVERIEKREGRLLTIPGREFVLKLFDRKSKSIGGNASFIGKLIRDACVIVSSARTSRCEPKCA